MALLGHHTAGVGWQCARHCNEVQGRYHCYCSGKKQLELPTCCLSTICVMATWATRQR